MPQVPTMLAKIGSFDSTRVVTYNHTAWAVAAQRLKCRDDAIAALRATNIGSADLYPMTRP